MKIAITVLLVASGLSGYSQQSDSLSLADLQQEIRQSKEAIAWRTALISYQKSNLKLCSLIEKQALNTSILSSCGKPGVTKAEENLILDLFRTMRITDELQASKLQKEKTLRIKYPQLTRHFALNEIFPEH